MESSKIRNDHYISQTYLRKFLNPNGKLWTYDKKYLGVKERSTKSICCEPGGSTNPYFPNNDLIENYLRPFENHWSEAIDVFTIEDNYGIEKYKNAKWIIAGYLAYLRFSPPSVVKSGQGFLESTEKDTLKILNKNGDLPPPPVGFEYLMDDIEKKIQVEIDPKFHQALALTALEPLIQKFLNSPWMILLNKSTEPFVTSDNPACMWYPQPNNLRGGKIYLALTPEVGILIDTFNGSKTNEYDQLKDCITEAKPHFVTEINTYLTKCALNIVISNINSEAIKSMVMTFKDWEYGRVVNSLPTPTGIIRSEVWRAIKK